MASAITGPIAPYNNFPVQAGFYQPSVFFISSLTLGVTTLVQTTVNHNYVIGQIVRLIIPSANQSYELNEQTGIVIDVPAANQVILNINSASSQPFVSTSLPNQPQINSVGDVNSGQTNSNGITSNLTYIPGSFINISPAV